MYSKMEMETIWCDKDFAEIRVVCSSAVVTASTQIYITNQLVDNLINQIKDFIAQKTDEAIWANEDSGDDTPASLGLRFINADKCGHVLIEVYMEIDDGGKYSDHHCCYYLYTEIGMLASFCEKLVLLHSPQPGVKIVLNDA